MQKVRIPPQSSIRHKVCYALFEHGSMTALQMHKALPALSTQNIHQALKGAAETGYVTRFGHAYTLNQHLVEHSRSMLEEKEVYVGEVATPRTFVINRPMKSLPWAVHMDKIRDIYFLNGSSSFANGVV